MWSGRTGLPLDFKLVAPGDGAKKGRGAWGAQYNPEVGNGEATSLLLVNRNDPVIRV